MDASNCLGVRFEDGLLDDPAEMNATADSMREIAAPIASCAPRMAKPADARTSEQIIEEWRRSPQTQCRWNSANVQS